MPFAIAEPINKELDRLKILGVISLTDYSEWAVPTVCVEKENDILVCVDFFLEGNECLLPDTYRYHPQKFFSKLKG